MIETLKRFTEESLFEASSCLLNKLNIGFEGETAEPINVADIYEGTMPQYLTEALGLIKATYFIGVANDLLLSGSTSSESFSEISETIENGGKYDGMFVFACDTKEGEQLSRTQASALTRAFNKISYANPVILVIREGDKISLATCERMNYTQEWRRGTGEKLGKVSILRNVNCTHPHRGHVDILDSLSSKVCKTFDELYQHWMEVFSSELLTKKFYNELSDWYAWAVQIAKFPNNLASNEDDDKYNHEACIRLITRLIFVWFLKQKHLIPEEFFDEKYIRENLIDGFDPHDKQNLYYDAGKSKYYRLVLQNLFFAMLNCPIVAEGKTLPNNRRFRADTGRNGNDYNMNNLMRYKSEFADKGAEKFVKLANASVPFLNGGLFDCLDNKPQNLYYDGFSERKESLEQLFIPDYLFFGEEVGASIDLSQWYGDRRKKSVSARGIVDILKRYSFTIEENTPYDQEVSLDPELLGKVFENLLASYNPETKQSARKQTGSFYTPREIVQYMVDESIVAHLMRSCGVEMESQYRALLSYASEDPVLTEEQCKAIMHALYDCRVLDPACGSGAFPMGVLQQMVHVLKRIDPTNKMWNSMMIDIAIDDARKELQKVTSDDEVEKLKIEENRRARLDDIENAFNTSINDPDYARKLYLIEHCIYGVDIQPIATQISKLRFFISLVVDQNKLGDPKSNFGIRPLPNLESKFVTANTLIPLKRDKTVFTDIEEVRNYEEELQELNHKIFLAKKNSIKNALKERMYSVRRNMAQMLENRHIVDQAGATQLIDWDMFDQNASAGFFDPEWMFGVKEGFDIVIGNPPYIKEYTCRAAFDGIRGVSPYYMGKMDLWYVFACSGLDFLRDGGVLCFIAQNNWTTSYGAQLLRKKITEHARIRQMLDFNQYMVFEDSAAIQTMVMLFANDSESDNYIIDFRKLKAGASKADLIDMLHCRSSNFVDYLHPMFIRENYKGKSILFETNNIFSKIVGKNSFLTEDEIAQGIVFPQDFLNKKAVNELNNPSCRIGDGVFGLSSSELAALDLGKEKDLIRPYYTSREIQKYFTNNENQLWMIYTNSSYADVTSLDNYPKIRRHLDKFQAIITSAFKPYGLHRSRNENIFKGPKILAQRKCVGSPLFSYSDFPCYVTQTYNIIQTNRCDMLYLTGVLNSKLVSYWLKHKGKMQGENYQLDKAPLMEIPIVLNSQNFEEYISVLVKDIINNKAYDQNVIDKIDNAVYHLYNLTYDEVLIVDPETPITRDSFDKFTVSKNG